MATTTTPLSITARDAFLGRIERALHNGNAPLALAATDLDRFGEINETHGHETGDDVLRAWEQLLAANLPSDAQVIRLGGDEYAVVLPGLSAEHALILLDEIRNHLGTHDVGAGVTVTTSLGVAANPPHGTTAEDLWRSAGEALMRAKRDGGDRVAIHVEEKMVLKSNYYSRANLERLAKLSGATARTEASLLREGLDDLLDKHSRLT